jgi:serine O-acetyltransferase
MALYRVGRWRYTIRDIGWVCHFPVLYKAVKPIGETLTGIELPGETTLRRRFRFDHFGGIITSGEAVFGDRSAPAI